MKFENWCRAHREKPRIRSGKPEDFKKYKGKRCLNVTSFLPCCGPSMARTVVSMSSLLQHVSLILFPLKGFQTLAVHHSHMSY
jgi:hypothetical protein